MTSPGPAFQECTGSYHENVHALKPVSSELRSTGGMTVMTWMEIVAILIHYQPSYNPLLLADVTLGCGMYPAGIYDIF